MVDKLPEDEQAEFKEKSQAAMKFLLGKIKELQLCGPCFCIGVARASPCHSVLARASVLGIQDIMTESMLLWVLAYVTCILMPRSPWLYFLASLP